MLDKGQKDGHIHGISIATNAPDISHLLCADDNILFCRARPKEAKAIVNILTQCQEASRKWVIMDKSEMIFSPNISPDFKTKFQENLLVKINDNIHKYLGMPTQFGSFKEQDFYFIMDKIWKKLKGWKEKSLSFEGRGFSSELWLKLSPHILKVVFFFLRAYVKN